MSRPLLGLLSLGFSAPDEETIEQLRRLTVLAARTVGELGLAECLADLEHALGQEDLLESLPPAYEEPLRRRRSLPAIRGKLRGRPDPLEQGDGGRGRLLPRLGVEPAGPAAERPDHAGCELEFLSFLAVRRLEAEQAGRTEQAAVCREAEDAFLLDHLDAGCRPSAVRSRMHPRRRSIG